MNDVSTTWAEVKWIVDHQLMVYIRLIVAVISQFSHDVIGCWDSSQWLVRFDRLVVLGSLGNEPNTTNAKPVTTATIPYIKGTSETIARILQSYNIRVAHKPITTLQQLLTNVKDKDEPNDRQGAVYKIKCCDCQASYIGKTGRNLNIWLTEHKRATKNGDVNNHIAEHHLHTNHRIDWDSAECVTYSKDYYKRLTLESWFTNLEQTSLMNRCQQLPAAYKRLVNRTDKH